MQLSATNAPKRATHAMNSRKCTKMSNKCNSQLRENRQHNPHPSPSQHPALKENTTPRTCLFCNAPKQSVATVAAPAGVLRWVQKHKGRLSGSLEVSNRGTMDRMFSTPLANTDRGITHRISKSRADFWKEEENQPQDKRDNHTGPPAPPCAVGTVACCSPLFSGHSKV